MLLFTRKLHLAFSLLSLANLPSGSSAWKEVLNFILQASSSGVVRSVHYLMGKGFVDLSGLAFSADASSMGKEMSVVSRKISPA